MVMNLYNFYGEQAERQLRKQKENESIRTVGIAAGLAIIAYVLIQNILSTLLFLTPLGELYFNNSTVQSIVTIFFTLFGIVIPFGACGFYLEKKLNTEVFNFGKPVDAPLMVLAIPLGFFVCLVGNYVTTYFVNIVGLAGITLTSPEFSTPTDLSGRIVYAIAISAVPALAEEFAMRGAVLQPLRRYGDRFAILASSIVFAVLHGNLVQAPFALIAGIGIGYAVCITNSIWTGVIIHFCNNLYAVLTEFMLADIADEASFNAIYNITTIVLFAVSVIGSVFFVIIKKNRKIMPSFTVATEGEKLKSFVSNIPMVIALIIMFLLTLQYIDIEWM